VDERIQELWSQYLAGEELSPADERELLAAMKNDGNLRAQLLNDERLDGMLHAAGRGKEDAESFTRSVADRLAAENTGRKFISGVRKRVQLESGQNAAAAPPRSTRRPLRRRSESWSPVSLAIAAIVALAALGIAFQVLTKKPQPEIVETPVSPKKTQPDAQPTPPSPAEKIVATLSRVDGDVVAIVRDKRVPAISGQNVVEAQGLELAANASAILTMPDSTRIDLKGGTTLRQISENESGKRIVVTAGALDANVTKQPPERPLLIVTPNAELKVIGTKFSVVAAASTTRLNVREGKVRLTRTADSASVDVAGGQYVFAEPAVALAVKPFGPGNAVITTKTGPIDSLAFSPDGKWLLAGCYDGGHVYDVEKLEAATYLPGHIERVRSVAWSHDGRLLATGSWDKTARIWEASSGKQLLTMTCKGNIWAVAFTPDDQTLLTGDFAKRLRFWNTRSGKEAPSFDPNLNEVLAIDFSPSGKMLTVGGTNGHIALYDADTYKERRVMKGEEVVESVSFSHDETMIASAQGENVRIWSVTGKLLQTMSGHTQTVRCVRFSPDDSIVISVSDDRTVRLWDIKTGESFATLTDHKDKVNAIAISPSGDVFVTAGAGQTIRFHRFDMFKK
jgi:WD40 repeat protein